MTSRSGKDRPTDRAPGDAAEPSFVRRWSRRKHQARTDEPEQERAQTQERTPAPPTEVHEAGSEADAAPDPRPELTDADMPAIESLGEGSDYRAFLSPRVSESLRRAALRKLFQSPRYNVRDGLDDYDGDFTRYTPLHDDSVTAHAKFHTERLRRRLQADADEHPADISAAKTEETPPRDHEGADGGLDQASSAVPGEESDATRDGAESRPNRA